MELFETHSEIESYITARASVLNQAIGGTMELLPLCNMHCKMCYIYHSKAEMEKEGKMLNGDQWLRIAQDLKDNGVLFLLLTGGEPLLHPDFKRIYATLLTMGFVITLNTNATLINEEMADFLAENRCRRLNISIYGTDDAMYGALCGNPRGFTQMSRAVKLLKERNIPFIMTYAPNPQNIEQYPQICDLAQQWGVNLTQTSYIFPPVRRCEQNDVFRLAPDEMAKFKFAVEKRKFPHATNAEVAKLFLPQADCPERIPDGKGLWCRAGHSGFWINWKGELQACGLIPGLEFSLLDNPFKEAWKGIVSGCEAFARCQKCVECKQRRLCQSCAAACLAETGASDRPPEYLCQVTDAFVELLRKYAQEEEKNEVE